MFCPSCGASLPDGSTYCTNCGQVFSPAPGQAQAPTGTANGQQAGQPPYAQPGTYQQPNAYQQQYQQPYQQTPPAQPGAYQQPYQQTPPTGQPYAQAPYAAPGNEKYASLGGWLLVLVILWALVGAYDIYTSISGWNSVSGYIGYLGSLGTAISLVFLLVAVGGAVCIAMAYLVFRRNPIFLRVYQIFSLAMIAAYLLLALFLFIQSRGASSYLDTSELRDKLFQSALNALVGLGIYTMYFSRSERVRTYMGTTEYLDRALFTNGNK